MHEDICKVQTGYEEKKNKRKKDSRRRLSDLWPRAVGGLKVEYNTPLFSKRKKNDWKRECIFYF